MRLRYGALLGLIMSLPMGSRTAYAAGPEPTGGKSTADQEQAAAEQALLAADERVQEDKRRVFALQRLLAEDVEALRQHGQELRDHKALGDLEQLAADRGQVLVDEERVRHTQHEIVFWRSILRRDQRAAWRLREVLWRKMAKVGRPSRGGSPKVSLR